jgi:SPP1 family predicted phage head-tail adaptor
MIGELRNRITIIRNVYESDGYGGQVLKTSNTRKVWAGIKNASGTEGMDMSAVVNTKTRTLVIRRTDIEPSDEIEMDGKRWLVSNIEKQDGKELYLLVYIREKEVSA